MILQEEHPQTPRPSPFGISAAAGDADTHQVPGILQKLCAGFGRIFPAPSSNLTLSAAQCQLQEANKGCRNRKVTGSPLFSEQYSQAREGVLLEVWQSLGIGNDFLWQRGRLHALEHGGIFLHWRKEETEPVGNVDEHPVLRQPSSHYSERGHRAHVPCQGLRMNTDTPCSLQTPTGTIIFIPVVCTFGLGGDGKQ